MSNRISISIGKNIKELREENGMERVDLATELGYSTSQYSKIEKGEQNLDCQGLATLCRLVQCRPERIVFGKEESKSPSVPAYFDEYSEADRRRLFRFLYLVLNCHLLEVPDYFHKMFGTDLLRIIPVEEKNIIPLVLEYERKNRNLTRRAMIKFLEISKNKYYSLLDGEELSSIPSLIKLSQKLNYDMSFLLMNEVRPELFLSGISASWNATEKRLFRQQLNLCLSLEELSSKFIDMQRRRKGD